MALYVYCFRVPNINMVKGTFFSLNHSKKSIVKKFLKISGAKNMKTTLCNSHIHEREHHCLDAYRCIWIKFGWGPIMKIDFLVFSERGEPELPVPAGFYRLKNIDLSQSQRLSIFQLYPQFSNAICCESPFFKLQNLSPSTIFEQSSPNFQDTF